MGLLSKAAPDTTKAELDDIGKILCSRIISLPHDSLAAETAISLLKTYSPFQAGLCLSRAEGSYRSYASVGMGTIKIELDENALVRIHGKNYYRVNYEAPSGLLADGCRFWAFSLDPRDNSGLRTIFDGKKLPAAIVMIASAVELPLDQIDAILRQCARRFIQSRINSETEETPAAAAVTEETSATGEGVELILERPACIAENGFIVPEDHLTGAGIEEVSVMEGVIAGRRGLLNRIKNSRPETRNAAPAVKTPPAQNMAEKLAMETLERARDQLGVFQGFIIEPIKYGAGEFAGRIAAMISPQGIVRALSPTRVLVLFNRDADGELVIHRITRFVQGRNVFSFKGNEIGETFSLIKSVL
ncbi:MAG: hypothetical protein LBB82_02765 [Treponema sp.]|jgi:hypothetical protein|nr:hypothetical protein [Treponema sp.]